MSQDVKSMTDELVRDADSLVFLQLGELLRAQGQTEAARKVAVTSLPRHPDLPDAHDLYARILLDANEPEQAQRAWEGALRLNPRHQGAHRGLGFLYYRRGDLDTALDHLELAVAADPTDQSVVQALRVVREAAESATEEPASESVSATPGVEDEGLLLFDMQGRPLAGGVSGGGSAAEVVAAHLAGVSEEIERTARMLKLGEWLWLVVEATDGNAHLGRPTDDALLLLVSDPGIPAGRLAMQAERATASAQAWLQAQRR